MFFHLEIRVKRLLILVSIFSLSFLLSIAKSDKDFYLIDLLVLRDKYQEFSIVQPQEVKTSACTLIEVDPIHHVSIELMEIVNFKKEINFKNNKIECYTIQVYSGADRSIAFSILQELNNVFQDVYMQYNDSNYTVRIGKCIDKLELCAKYIEVLKYFSNIKIRSVTMCKGEIFFRS